MAGPKNADQVDASDGREPARISETSAGTVAGTEAWKEFPPDGKADAYGSSLTWKKKRRQSEGIEPEARRRSE